MDTSPVGATAAQKLFQCAVGVAFVTACSTLSGAASQVATPSPEASSQAQATASAPPTAEISASATSEPTGAPSPTPEPTPAPRIGKLLDPCALLPAAEVEAHLGETIINDDRRSVWQPTRATTWANTLPFTVRDDSVLFDRALYECNFSFVSGAYPSWISVEVFADPA